MTALIEVSGLCKSYGAHQVLKDISFEVADGEGFVIIGPNGAGKSTMFKSMTGEAAINGGTVRFDGQDVTEMPAHERVRLGMARTFQVSRVFLEFTALENLIAAIEARLDFFHEPKGKWWQWRPVSRVVDEAMHRLDQIGLGGKHLEEARNLSHGDKKKLELAIALASEPRVLMLDEPTAGMSPAERHQAIDLLRRILRDHRMTLVLTEHDMDVVFGLADRIMVLNYGELIAIGQPEEVRRDPHVMEIYLGQEMTDA